MKYLVSNDKFHIIEHITNHKNEQYDRAYIMEQVANRPYFMRVTFLAQINVNY